MSGWKHTAPPDLLYREGTTRPPMKKGTTLLRGSALSYCETLVVTARVISSRDGRFEVSRELS